MLIDLPKIKLINISNKIEDYAKCVIIYGSRSINLNKKVTSSSDIDFFIIYKNETNPHFISLDIEQELNDENIKYDYCWYLEDYFLKLLEKKIDFYLWRSIFFNGEVIFDDSDFVNNVQNKILETNPGKLFGQTYVHRNQNINNAVKMWARNLSRILFDYIGAEYCNKINITTWDLLPSNNELIEQAYKTGVINNDIYDINSRLIEICKKTEEEIDINRYQICRGLTDIDLFISKLINSE